MVTERRLIRKLLSAFDTSRSLSQNTVASLNSYRSHVRVKLMLPQKLQVGLSFVLSVRSV